MKNKWSSLGARLGAGNPEDRKKQKEQFYQTKTMPGGNKWVETRGQDVYKRAARKSRSTKK